MAESYPGKLQIWQGWVPGAPTVPGPRSQVGGRPTEEIATRLYDDETLHADCRPRQRAEPGSLQWFLDIEAYRHGRRGAWIPRLLEFRKHGGESLLGLGESLGTDWVQYARHGAQVSVCSHSVEQLAIIQRNFELRGLRGNFLQANAGTLPVEGASIDVVCLSTIPTGSAEQASIVDEIYRVLKPGGKVLALATACYDIDYWRRWLLPWEAWLRSKDAKAAGSEGFTGRRLRRLFGRFVEPRIYKRYLRRGEIPHLWRCWPRPLLERLMGRFLLLKAFKPLASAIAIPVAA